MPITPISIGANKKNLLKMVQQACDEIGITSPTSIFGNTDSQVKQLLALAQREGQEVSTAASRLGGWQELRGEYTFNTAGVSGYTGNITSGSPTITNLSINSNTLTTGWITTDANFPVLTSILTLNTSSTITMSANATATSTGEGLSFGAQSYSLPSDFGYFMTQTFWDRAFRWQLLGPLEPQEWQVLKSGISPTGPRRRFRVMGNLFYIDPVPNQINQEVFEYYSNQWCQSAGGTGQTAWTADTDYYNLDDDIFILGLQRRFKQKKGLSYDQEEKDWSDRIERCLARNGGNRNLPLNASASGVRLLNNNNVPDTGFGT